MTLNRIAVVAGDAGGIGSAIGQAFTSAGGRVVDADRDLSGEQSVAELFETVEAQFGPVATLVCIAGGTPVEGDVRMLIATTTLETWIECEKRNSRASFLWVREYLRRRTVRGVTDGRIVTIVSSAALQTGAAITAAHATSEAGILAVTRIASLEAGPLGITVNAIVVDGDDVPAADVAEAVCFLSSAEARHITGATIAIGADRI